VEQAVIVVFLFAVVVIKGSTMVWLAARRKEQRELESDDLEVSERLRAIEATKLQLERERKALDKKRSNLETDKNLVSAELQRLGVVPVPESELDATDSPSAADAGSPKPAEETGDAGAGPADAAQATGPGGEAGPRRRRVLVVEDNEELREILDQALAKDYDVDQAPDGLEAMAKIHKQNLKFDLVITDLKMPNIDGLTLLRSLPRETPAVVISAFVQEEEFRVALEQLKPAAVLQKPFKLVAVRQAVEAALPAASGAQQVVDGGEGE